MSWDQALSALGGTVESAAQSQGSGTRRPRPDEPMERRTKLRRYDHVATQALNAGGESPMKTVGLQSLWNWVKAGNKAVAFYHEMASEDAYRRGVSISRLSQTLLCMKEAMGTDNIKALIKPSMLEKARSELAEVQEFCTILDGGKATQHAKETIWSKAIAKKNDREAVTSAAIKLHAWLMDDSKVLKHILAILSCGGVFYAASCAEKTMRAALSPDGGGINRDEFVAAAVARLCSDTAAEVEPESWASLSQHI